MRKLLLLATVVFVVLVILYRDRLYLRDPLGTIERNGVAVPDARLFINYSNDVLVQENHGTEMFVVQNWSRRAATPSRLTCVQGMLCITPADRIVDAQAADSSQMNSADSEGKAEMSSRAVSFTDAAGSHIHITLR